MLSCKQHHIIQDHAMIRFNCTSLRHIILLLSYFSYCISLHHTWNNVPYKESVTVFYCILLHHSQDSVPYKESVIVLYCILLHHSQDNVPYKESVIVLYCILLHHSQDNVPYKESVIVLYCILLHHSQDNVPYKESVIVLYCILLHHSQNNVPYKESVIVLYCILLHHSQNNVPYKESVIVLYCILLHHSQDNVPYKLYDVTTRELWGCLVYYLSTPRYNNYIPWNIHPAYWLCFLLENNHLSCKVKGAINLYHLYPTKYTHGFVMLYHQFIAVINWWDHSDSIGRIFMRFICPYPSGLLHWHWGNGMIAPVPAEQPWRIWVKSANTKPNRMAWQWAETLVEIRGTLADIRGTSKLGCKCSIQRVCGQQWYKSFLLVLNYHKT